MRKVILISGAALALAGCGKLATVLPGGSAQTPPARRAGLWQQVFVRDGVSSGPSMMGPVRVCVDAGSEAKSPIFNFQTAIKQAHEHHCSDPVSTRGLDGSYSFSADCPLPGVNGRAVLKGTASGDFTTAFHMRLVTDITRPAPFTKLDSHHVVDIDGTWQGPCPAGVAPGDMLLANGTKAPGGRLVNPHEKQPPTKAPPSPGG